MVKLINPYFIGQIHNNNIKHILVKIKIIKKKKKKSNLPPKWSANQQESWDPLICINVTLHRSWVPPQVQRLRLPPQRTHGTGHRVPEQRQVCESHVQDVKLHTCLHHMLTTCSCPTQTQRDAYDYQLSADHKYVAFISNHTKVHQSFLLVELIIENLLSDQLIGFCFLSN